jgi:hypothetical protein
VFGEFGHCSCFVDFVLAVHLFQVPGDALQAKRRETAWKSKNHRPCRRVQRRQWLQPLWLAIGCMKSSSGTSLAAAGWPKIGSRRASWLQGTANPHRKTLIQKLGIDDPNDRHERVL